MQFYFTPENASAFQCQQQSLSSMFGAPAHQLQYQRTQPTNWTYFNGLQAKPQAAYQEIPDSYTFHTDASELYSSRYTSFASFENNVEMPSSPYSPAAFFDKDQTYENFTFNLDSQTTSLESGSEPSCYDSYRQKPAEFTSSPVVDGLVCADEDLMLEQAQDNLLSFQQSLGANRAAIKEEPNHSEKALFTTNFGGHGMKGWCPDDEVLLRKLVVQYKFDWKKIAKKFANKKYTPHFLKMRYRGYDEGPVPKRVKFSHQEDILIANYFNTYGIDWERMAHHFPNRTPIMLKNRYYSHIRKNNKLGDLLKEQPKGEASSLEQYTPDFSEDTKEDSIFNSNQSDSQSQGESWKDESEGKKESRSEVAILRAKFRSLKSLYLMTYKELSKLKSNSAISDF